MSDRLRIIEFSKGGRPIEILDLEQVDLGVGGHLTAERDSFKFTPPPQRNVEAKSNRRWGGSRQVAQAHDNGTLAGRWIVRDPGGSADVALANIAEFVAAASRSLPGRYIEWCPEGASHSTYFEARGTASWEGEYRWIQWAQTQQMLTPVSFPVAPLPRWDKQDIFDPFDDADCLDDYLFVVDPAGELTVAGGEIAPAGTLTTERRGVHTARGYTYRGGQGTLHFVPGATITGFKAAVVLRRFGPDDYLEAYVDDNGTNSRLRIDRVVAGTPTNLVSENLAARLADGVEGWVRGRVEGSQVYAEHFLSAPTPMGAPTNDVGPVAHGVSAAGYPGWGWIPRASDARLLDFEFLPHVWRNKTLPARIVLDDPIPGDDEAPAEVDLHVTPSGGAAAPVWAMFGWSTRPATPLADADAPFGIIEAESADSLSTWAVTADADYRGGSGLQATASGAGTASAEWAIDPSTLIPDAFTLQELDIEVWARVELASTLVSPKLTLSAKPDAGTNFGAERFAGEFGSAGKLLVKPSSGARFRHVRLGVITVVCDPQAPVKWRIKLAGAWSAGSSGIFGADQLQLVPARQHACGPTGKPLDDSYPKFVASTAETTKIIRADGSGLVAQPPTGFYPDHGLGQVLELPPGDIDVLLALSSLVPDNPTSDATSEQEEHQATVHLPVWPRGHFARGG